MGVTRETAISINKNSRRVDWTHQVEIVRHVFDSFERCFRRIDDVEHVADPLGQVRDPERLVRGRVGLHFCTRCICLDTDSLATQETVFAPLFTLSLVSTVFIHFQKIDFKK